MKRILTTILLVFCILQAHAVLKEKDLPHTLGVLKAELKADHEKMKMLMQRYETMSAEQHAQLISYMKRSEQIGLILYSQKADFTFDMAYACQEATQMFRELKQNTMPYDRILTRINQEIERYTELIALLKRMPPAVREARDSITQIDSLAIVEADSLAALDIHPQGEHVEEEHHDEPFFLDTDELADRAECLIYAEDLLEKLQNFIDNITKEQGYYDQVTERVQKLNDFAQSRYQILQKSIFQDGGKNYFAILLSMPRQWKQVTSDINTKYKPLATSGNSVSEWRGSHVGFIGLFLLIYLTASFLISNIILRWLMPKRFRTEQFMHKRHLFIWVLAIGLFAVAVLLARHFTDSNIILMGTSLMITFAWLTEAILLSLLIRLDDEQMKAGVKIYTPFVWMALVVIVFRIILIPNSLVNLIYPPILLVFTIWQLRMIKRHREGLPHFDMFYSSISLIAMIVATITSWVGYTLLAVEIMMWWMFQLTAIQAITCLYDLLKTYEAKRLVYRVMPRLRIEERQGSDITSQVEELQQKIKKGKYINKTWLYDFMLRAAIPTLAVLSVVFSIFWAAEIFEMTSICLKVFKYNFIEQEGVISLSLFKICLVAGSWFLFSYLNYFLRAFYHYVRLRTLGDSKEDYNGTLANNIISILVWGAFFIYALVLLRVPRSGISIVTAGLATGMGFAMKDLLENFFYGISLMSGRVRVGDYIECDGIRGRVDKITYQSTMIYTMDGCVIAFLNTSLFSKNFKNLTRNHQYELVKIPVGIAYGSNVQEVRKMLQESLQPLLEIENVAGKHVIDENTTIKVEFSGFGDNSVDLLVCLWILVEESIPLQGKAKEIIYNTLNDNNISIPFPQRDIYVHQLPDINVTTKAAEK
ncbi:MAG: mechanosensitive ion channel family protein [Bacteroidales bacterium]|nr:mechanosensitive ion channel family protein [Bacteroidales bacterium]